MYDSRRYLGTGAVLSLVLLRLVIGWHFFTEGLDKIEYDERTAEVRVSFTAAPFLMGAKGPLADFYQSQAASVHDWPRLLAVPKAFEPLSKQESDERGRWAADYRRRRAEAEENKTTVPADTPPFAPYHEWAARIVADWNSVLARFGAIPGLTDEQKQAATKAFDQRSLELADYLAGESEAIADYQHQLSRLESWRAAPEGDDVPFTSERIERKSTETSAAPRAWLDQVELLDQAYLADLRAVLSSEQRANNATIAAVTDALTLPSQKWLRIVNVTVTVLTIAVGLCLLLGLFTRPASLAGALFLLAVVATQPPWVPDAQPIIQQAIELAGLLVLAGTGAGRWLGLDFFTHALFGRRHAEST